MIRLRIFAIAAALVLTAGRASAQLVLLGASGNVCQLNGETVWATGAPTAAQTQSSFGMQAADLGTPVDTGGSTLYFLFGDTWPIDHPPGSPPQLPPDDSVGTSTLTAPPTSTTCLGLQLATSSSSPPTLARPTVTPAIDQGLFNVPSGGVYVGGSLYEFFWADHCVDPNPLPASATDPLLLPTPPAGASCLETATLNSIGISVLGQSASGSDTAFNQATTGGTPVTMPSGFVYVNAVDAEHAPNLAPSGQRHVFITGVPRYRASVPYLAYSTAADIGDPTKWMYFNGLSLGTPNWISYTAWESKHNTAGRWVPPSSGAEIYSPTTDEACVGEHSLTWNAPLNSWLLLYNCNTGGERQIEARYAPAPWGPWSDPIVLLSPAHDPGIFCTLIMRPAGCPGLANMQPLNKDGTYQYGLYAPFVMSRFTQDETPKLGPPCEPVVGPLGTVMTCVFRSTIYWLLSTWNPYYVVVMQSTLQLTTRSAPMHVGAEAPTIVPPVEAGPVTPLPGSPVEGLAGEVVLNVTVTAIDRDSGLLTVTGPLGNATTLKAAPDLLGRATIGEPVTLRFADAVVTALRKADAAPRRESGDPNTIEVMTTLAAVDYGNRTVTFRRPNGTPRTVKVSPGAQGLEAVRRGDQIVMLLTRAVALDITPRTVSAQPFEPGINRIGADYRSFIPRGGPRDCQAACGADSQCRAWTYVHEGIQGPAPRCWLKANVPAPTSSECCVSGVMR